MSTRTTPLAVQLERQGVFEVGRAGRDASQCGRRGIRKVGYTVRITGDDRHLTPEGFIIDNTEIHNYFTQKYTDVEELASCENIAANACRDFRSMFGRGHLENVKVNRIEVRIAAILPENPVPVAGITALWERPTRRVQ
jgi:hypothetical protein